MSSKKVRLLQSMWARLSELFPWLEDYPDLAISWSPPHMIWQLSEVDSSFWERVVRPLLEDLKPLGISLARHKFIEGVYYIQIPFEPFETSKFREWARFRDDGELRDGEFDTVTSFTLTGSYADYYDDEDYSRESQEINENPVYDDEFYTKKGW